MVKLTYHDYQVGWICAIGKELTAAVAMLDQEHPPLKRLPRDDNIYTFGRIGDHNIVIAPLPAGEMASVAAARVSKDMSRTFTDLKFSLLVGIAGGVPLTANPKYDVRLGDVVVSKPREGSAGVLQYDLVRDEPAGFKIISFSNAPPPLLRSAVMKLAALHDNPTASRAFIEYANSPKLSKAFKHPGVEHDKLFVSSYPHPKGADTCIHCSDDKLASRPERSSSLPEVHYGLIASGNRIVENAGTRDQLAEKHNILCFEMEAAGLMNSFPCLVIKAISDYADTHKRKQWHRYAAAVAAGYAKELLSAIPAEEVNETVAFGQTAVAAKREESGIQGEGIHESSLFQDLQPQRSTRPFGFSFILDRTLNWDEAALGRLVLDLKQPSHDFFHPPTGTESPRVSIHVFNDISPLINQWKNSSAFITKLQQLIFGDSARAEQEFADSTESKLVTYKLLNHGSFFGSLVRADSTKQWLETVYQRHYVYLIVAIHSLINTLGSEDPETDKAGFHWTLCPGDRIIAVQYRKLCFQRFSSSKVSTAYLEDGNCWKEYNPNGDKSLGPEEDFIRVDLDEGTDPDTYFEEDRKFELFESGLTGERYVLMV
jgi:nucleoside phosphorylase